MSITFGTAFGGNGPAPTLSFVAGGLGGAGTRGVFGTFGKCGGTSGAPGTCGGESPFGAAGILPVSAGRADVLPSPSVGEWK